MDIRQPTHHPGRAALALPVSLEQFDYQVTDTFFPMDCESSRDYAGEFRGLLDARQLGQLGFAAVKSTPLDVYRRRRHIGQVSDSTYLVKIQVAGQSVILQRGREAHLRPGDFTVCLSSEPYELHFACDYSQVVLAVPSLLMEECVHQPERHLGMRMDSSSGANGLFTQFVISIAQKLDSIDGVLAQRLEANVIDLLATTLGYTQETQRRDLHSNGVKIEYLHRIKQFMRKHLQDERLAPEWIASAHNISTRYLHMLFEAESASVSRYIQNMRLQASRLALSDPAFAHFTVCEIAYRSGFKDSSHFSRVFKSEFGEAPARFRKQSLDCGGADT
ncbi:MAG TPA: helix-turn-helix domain-containing protein [Kineobactrum sp.]